MLTTVQIKSAKPKSKAYKIYDAGGLFVLVRPNAAKLWRYKFRVGGVEGLLALGSFPDVGLAEARQAHADARKLVTAGINPVLARSDQKQAVIRAQLERKKGTFEAVVADWAEATAPALSKNTLSQREREIRKNLLPKLKNRPLQDISRVEITRLLKEVEKRAPEVARNLRNYLWGIFEYAIDSGLITSTPVPSARVLKKRIQKHQLAIPENRLGEFLVRLDDRTKQEEPTRIAMLLVILTVCRKSEVIGGKWSELDLATESWTIPAERMKNRKDHYIPLSSQAMELIRSLRTIIPKSSEYMFPNRRDHQRPMANRSLNALMGRHGYEGIATPHGMRTRFSSHFNDETGNPDVVERCLSHVPANKTRDAYNRYEYKAERKRMLQTWADLVDEAREKVRTPD